VVGWIDSGIVVVFIGNFIFSVVVADRPAVKRGEKGRRRKWYGKRG